MSRNLRGLSARRGLKEGLYEETCTEWQVPVIHQRMRELTAIADDFMTGRAAALGVSSFYDFLDEDHYGKKVFVCDGTACLTSGRQADLKQRLLERYSEHEIGTMTCLGHCHSNNAFMVKGEIRVDGTADDAYPHSGSPPMQINLPCLSS